MVDNMKNLITLTIIISVCFTLTAFGDVKIALLKISGPNRDAETITAIDALLASDSTIDMIIGPAENLGGDSNKARIIFAETPGGIVFDVADTFCRSLDVLSALNGISTLAGMHGVTIIPGTIWEVDSNLHCFEAIPIFGPDGDVERIRRKAHQTTTDTLIDDCIRLDTIFTRDGNSYSYLITVSNESANLPEVYGYTAFPADLWIALDRRWMGDVDLAIDHVEDAIPPNWSIVYTYSNANNFSALLDSNWITPQTPLLFCDFDSFGGATITGNIVEGCHPDDDWFIIPDRYETPHGKVYTLDPDDPTPIPQIIVFAVDTFGVVVESLFVNYGDPGTVPIYGGWTDDEGLFKACFAGEESLFFMFSIDSMIPVPEETTVFLSMDSPRCTLFVILVPDSTTSISSAALPMDIKLSVAPNPFNSACKIISKADINIYDISGKRVRAIEISESKCVIWDGMDDAGGSLPSGLYFVETVGSHNRERCKIILLR